MIAGAISAAGAVRWVGAIVAGTPVLYGEGAVVNAAQLIWSGSPYAARSGEMFVSANYPPLYLLLASVGPAFLAARLITFAATLAIAVLIYWRARDAGRWVSFALAASWLAAVPVLDWGVAAKPDLLAVALVVGAALAAERRLGGWTAVLLVAAIAAKPTAVLPATGIVLWLIVSDRRQIGRLAIGAAISGATFAGLIAWFGVVDVWRHVVSWNALVWDFAQVGLLGLLLLVALGGLVVSALLVARGVMRAYLLGALAIVALGGREGATINYLLDVTAASFVALAASAPWSPLSRRFIPVLVGAQLVVGLFVLDPLGIGGSSGTGHWGNPARVDALRTAFVPGAAALVEDAGLLIALGQRPVVDDLFLWSRLVERGIVDPTALVTSVREARFALIASEVDLNNLSEAPAYERARWTPVLVDAVLSRYAFERSSGGLWLYRPR